MNLTEIIGVMRKHATPFDFSEIVEEVVINYAKAKFSNEAQVKIERAVAKELMRLAKSQNFNRQKSQRTYAKYKSEYYSRLHFNYSEVDEKSLADKISAANIVYAGDFHPLKAPKNALLSLLKKIILETPVVLALECLPERQQVQIDKFMRGDCAHMPFDTSWYMPFELCGGLLKFAKESSGRIKIAAIGPDYSEYGDFSTSDKFMAPIIARQAVQNSKTVVFVGDYHIAKMHLPAKVRKLRSGLASVILYQNSTSLYWHMRSTMGKCLGAVKFSEDEYCIFNSSPLVKYQSAIDQISITEDSESPEQKVNKILASVYLLLLCNNNNFRQEISEE